MPYVAVWLCIGVRTVCRYIVARILSLRACFAGAGELTRKYVECHPGLKYSIRLIVRRCNKKILCKLWIHSCSP